MITLDTDVRFTAGMIKERFSPKKKASNGAVRGLYQYAIQLYGIEDVLVIVPNVRDATGVLIHPSECSQKITAPVPVMVDVNLRLWTFGPDEKRLNSSRVYQTGLRSMGLLPTTGVARALQQTRDQGNRCQREAQG
ncbi:hypothetical protein F4604DRAFT_1687398 [Suillus subluteus]|nr:hypothetical protein F4604DRAFT_1687398 [Suillus subluteus]